MFDYIVLLADGTVGTMKDGTIDGHPAEFIGKTVKIQLRDENGNPIAVAGVLIEILSEAYTV